MCKILFKNESGEVSQVIKQWHEERQRRLKQKKEQQVLNTKRLGENPFEQLTKKD